jgi:tetratricopeptide (TPR) repeat protein
MQNKDESIKVGDKINEFVQRNRGGIFICMGVIIFLLVGFVVFLSVHDVFLKKGISEVEELNLKFFELHLDHDHGEEQAHEYADAFSPEVDEFLAQIISFADKKSGYPAGRAWALAGQIYTKRKDWPNAQEAWQKAAKAASKTFLAPAAYFNAAAAAEEQGNREEAVELYKNCVSHPFDFVAAPRAQFSIGRLNEELGNVPAAIEAYRVILTRWPSIAVWANLAQSRLAVIEVQ